MTNETQNTDIEDVVENIIKDFDEEYPSARSYTGGRLEEYIGEKIRQALTTHGQKMYERGKIDLATELQNMMKGKDAVKDCISISNYCLRILQARNK